LREHYDEIRGLGAEVVAVGTGDRRYAADFVEQEQIPFPVLVDDDAVAARAAALPKVNPFRLVFDPRSLGGARRAHRAGYRVKKPGRRTNQLGGTFVLGPADRIGYEHVDEHTADHAPLDHVLAALRA
jgi:peroxiredoxin